ncbi:hypothetical protein [Kineococcus esterisolvens]|uniref:hypothetical protein n=1 Tax=unclassified Kineococcus TaxID=2621656 RepID=UPI003D7C51DE
MQTAGVRQPLGKALRRFWLVAVLAAVVSGLAAYAAVGSVSRTTYVANALYIVPTAPATADGETSAPTTLPTSPYDAERLAQNYALVLGEDAQLLDGLAATLGVTRSHLLARVVVENVPSSAAIRVTYTGDSAAEVENYFTALTDLLNAPQPNIPQGNLRALSLPNDTTEQAGLAPLAPVIAVVVGLLVGVGGALLLERMDSRLRTASDLRRVVPWPVFDLTRGQRSARVQTVVLRILSESPTRHVAVATVPGGSAGAVDALVHEVRSASLAVFSAERRGSSPYPNWHPVGELGTDGAAERRALEGDAVLLVVGSGARARDVETAVSSLHDVGVESVVVVLDAAARRPREHQGAPRAAEQPELETAGDDAVHAVPDRR